MNCQKKFLKLFRLDKHASRELVNELSNFMEAESRATHIPKHIRVLTTLHFLGHGSYQCGVGCSYSFALSQPAVSRCIREVTDVMVTNLLNQWIKFPNTRNEFNALKQDFTEEFPLFRNLVGVIDGTQIQIIAPPQHHEIYPAAPYYCRKGYYSINTQIVCDAQKKILNMNARFPGSVHDSAIWTSSTVRNILNNQFAAGQENYLFGDSGYPLEPWLLTPFNNPQEGEPEARFNNHLSMARIKVEHTIGILKSRFRCLLGHRALHCNPIRTAKIIYSCGILHNIASHFNVELPEDVNIMPEQQEANVAENNNWFALGTEVRNNILQENFLN
ncbi:hypothetical protein MML48_2g00002635 [Holotrichia oblita]|uniref:Uncharacterized protein n=1 Tax=Holotrichia oblita TaxID=644536 RepID=A0ACB9TMY4_HOLOL|nr:hypothetical protein MML48_2g00002635 [Holotrichia oblita]